MSQAVSKDTYIYDEGGVRRFFPAGTAIPDGFVEGEAPAEESKPASKPASKPPAKDADDAKG